MQKITITVYIKNPIKFDGTVTDFERLAQEENDGNAFVESFIEEQDFPLHECSESVLSAFNLSLEENEDCCFDDCDCNEENDPSEDDKAF